jgi:hypothetical protein
VKRRTAVIAAAVVLILAGAVSLELWSLRSGSAGRDRAEYPADPADQPPVATAFDTSTVTVPGCPTDQPEAAPADPGVPGDDKLVEWGAVRLVRCTYFGPTTYELEQMSVIEDVGAVTDAVRVLRRMLTAAQFTNYFGVSLTGPSLAMAVPTFRYLFQFPDGHVTEVDERGDYYRGGIVRYRWSVRGTSIAPLQVRGSRTCGLREAWTCRVTGTMVTLPD